MSNYSYSVKRDFGGLSFGLISLLILIVLFYILWMPLGIASFAAYIFLLYREFRKFSYELTLYDSYTEIKSLKFTRYISEKIPFNNLVEIEGIHHTGSAATSLLKIKSDNIILFELGGHFQSSHLYPLLAKFVDLKINTKLTASLDQQTILKKLNEVGLTGKLIYHKTAISTFKLN
ncbi:MAG: hypothetical protein K2X86_08470 [Cytophagaceae bacterium]|nr:hypothetical protein [Cytophagaceae bacterium]